MKNFIVILSCVICNIYAFASDITLKSIVEITNDITARTNSILDESNDYCAFIRMNFPSTTPLAFGDMVRGDITYLPGEYMLYIKPNSEKLSFNCEGDEYSLQFSEYGINIEGKKRYRIVFNKDNKLSTSSSPLYITANYDNVTVAIDGIPIGETPVMIDDLSPGQYTLSIPNKWGVTMPDTIITIEKDTKNSIFLSLMKKEREIPDFSIITGATGDGIETFEGSNYGIKTISSNGKKGMSELTGEIIVPCDFDEVTADFRFLGRDRFIVKNNNKYGVYKFPDGLIIPCMYDDMVYSDKGYKVKKNNLWGAYDIYGNLIVPNQFLNVDFGSDLIIVEEKDNNDSRGSHLFGLYDYSGKIIEEPKFIKLKRVYEDGRSSNKIYFKDITNRAGVFNKVRRSLIPATQVSPFTLPLRTLQICHQQG